MDAQGEAEVLERMQELRAGGSNLQAIADELNGRGVSTPRGKAWKPGSVEVILKRVGRVHAGER